VCPFNDAGSVERVLAEYRNEVAAVILEPIPHNVGCIVPRPGFLERLRELCTAHGTVLIFDEVICGFRHGLGGYQAIADVVPDLTAVGKAMANGYPIGALGGRADLIELLSTTPGQPVFFAGTFNGHPAMAAAALATIEKLEREPVHERVYELGQRARTGLEGVMRGLGISAVVAGFGSVFVTYFLDPPVDRYDDLLRNDVELFVGYRHELLTRGIFELPLNLKRSHVSYAHTPDQIDRLVEATESSVAAVLQRRGTDRNRKGGAMRPGSRQGVASFAYATTRVTGGF
jgi:glutamate-1-semialdehyde 2,1-aminomutase